MTLVVHENRDHEAIHGELDSLRRSQRFSDKRDYMFSMKALHTDMLLLFRVEYSQFVEL